MMLTRLVLFNQRHEMSQCLTYQQCQPWSLNSPSRLFALITYPALAGFHIPSEGRVLPVIFCDQGSHG